MSILSDKVAKAASTLNLPFQIANNDREKFVWDCLMQLGITDDEDSCQLLLSADCREGDARKVFCETAHVPVPRFLRIWSILRAGSSQEPCSPPTTPFPGAVEDEGERRTREMLRAVLRPIGQWTDGELLDSYSPTSSSIIEKELKERSKGRNCFVFQSGGDAPVVAEELSLRLLKEARRREMPMTYHDGTKAYRVYPAGEFPEQLMTLCPVTGKPSLDGYSEDLGFKWELDYEALIFVHLVHKSGVQINAFTARDIQKEWKEKGLEGLKAMFPKVAATYEDLKEIHELPSLYVRTGGRSSGRQDPMGGKRF